MKRLMMMMVILLPAFAASAQEAEVSGRVIDRAGEPLPGVFVIVKGTTTASATDVDGLYSVKAGPEEVLEFSCMGYRTQEVKVGGRKTIDVVMEDDFESIEETVVVGYGSQKSRDLTAPIVNIKGESLASQALSDPMSALQGKVAGVQVISSGAPGAGPSVRIRGMGSIGDYAAPLYIVDGAFVDNLDFVSPSDIQEITVLKDASSAAIYGVRAANGVVIVTTRRGSGTGAVISYDGYAGLQIPVNIMKLSDKIQYIDMLNEANASVSGYVPKDPSAFPASTDWYSVLLRNAFIQNHSISVTGTRDKTRYSAGLSYFSQEGIMNADNGYGRLNFRSRLEQNVADWLDIGFNVLLSRYDRRDADTGAFFQAFVNPPLYGIWNEENTAAYPHKFDSPQLYGFGNSYSNPYAQAEYGGSQENGLNLVFSTFAEIKMLKDRLKFRTSYNLDYQAYMKKDYTPEYFVGGSQGVSVSTLNKTFGIRDRHVVDNTLTFGDRSGKSSFTLMLGQSMRIEKFSGMTGSAVNVPGYDEQSIYLSNGSTENQSVSDKNPAPYRYNGLSFFTRGSYNYDDRYLATLTFRADGSSKYNRKWGLFPSVGLGWVVTEEDFMSTRRVLDFLKVRASWGRLGNDAVPANSTAILGSSGVGVSGVFGDRLVDGLGAQTVLQNYLDWEVVSEFDAGIDFRLFNNKLIGEIDYYNRTTDNVVFYVPVATGGGVAELLSNNGKVRNSGVEFSISWGDRLNDDFSYNIGLNLTTVANKVISLEGRDFIPGASVRGNYSTRTQVGYPIGSFWGYVVEGVFSSDLEALQRPVHQEIMKAGYFKYKDIDGNGLINEDDRTYLGSPLPWLIGGLEFGFSWKNIDFSLALQGQAGNKVLNAKRMNRDVFTDGNYDLDFYSHAWRPDRMSQTYPSAEAYNTAFIQQANSFFVEDASYLRISNVQLGYTFHNIKGLRTMRVSLSAQKPYTFFTYKGFTPEVSGSPIASGIDTSTYPMQGIYTLGLKFNF